MTKAEALALADTLQAQAVQVRDVVPATPEQIDAASALFAAADLVRRWAGTLP